MLINTNRVKGHGADSMRQPKPDFSNLSVFLFFVIPTVMLLIGYVVYPYPSSGEIERLTFIPLFVGLVVLGIGFIWNHGEQVISRKLKASGWVIFSFYWAMQPTHLYLPNSDVFNGVVCVVGVYVLMYMAYHEWLCCTHLKGGVSCLNWIAGATFLAGIIYFTVDTGVIPELKYGLIEIVASHSAGLLTVLGVHVTREGAVIVFNDTPITIIFACTAIQSMVLFVGMIGAVGAVGWKRKIIGLLVTVVPIYFLNLIRNAGVIFLVGGKITSFEMAHNIIAKAGSLIALIVLLVITFRIIPELYDEIMCLIDLPKQKGPVEQFFSRLVGKKNL